MANKILPVSLRRKRKQRGTEAIEFGLWALLMAPAFVWMFINGFNLIRFNKASDVTRSSALMYIKGSPMLAIGNQKIVARIANGLNLQVTDAGGTNIVTNQGDGLVILTRVQYVGATCGCNNPDQYVMTQRMYLGNRSLQINGQSAESFAGAPPSNGIWSATTGDISDYTNDANARVSSAFRTLWGNTLTDGQAVYLVETYFKTPSVGSGEFDSRGIYSRVFM